MKLKIKDTATLKQLNEVGIAINEENYFNKVIWDENRILGFYCGDSYYSDNLEEVAIKIYKLTKADLLEEVEENE